MIPRIRETYYIQITCHNNVHQCSMNLHQSMYKCLVQYLPFAQGKLKLVLVVRFHMQIMHVNVYFIARHRHLGCEINFLQAFFNNITRLYHHRPLLRT